MVSLICPSDPPFTELPERAHFTASFTSLDICNSNVSETHGVKSPTPQQGPAATVQMDFSSAASLKALACIPRPRDYRLQPPVCAKGFSVPNLFRLFPCLVCPSPISSSCPTCILQDLIQGSLFSETFVEVSPTVPL